MVDLDTKIAICIVGEMRYWEITKHIFKNWDADFFVSTWDTTDREEENYPYKFHGNSNINDEMIETLNLKGYEFLSREVENKIEFHIPKYYYLIYRCNLLKTQYELDNNFKYDCVLMTRSDVLASEKTQYILSQKLDENYIYLSEVNYRDEYYGYGTMDTVAYGTSATMDIFSSLYKYIFMGDNYNMIPMGHSLMPFYVKHIGLDLGTSRLSQHIINKIRQPEEYKKLLNKNE
jgi:hypothetical protein